MREPQLELPMFKIRPASENVQALIELLRGHDWLTSRQLAAQIGWSDETPREREDNGRKLRAIAAASNGRIAGGQRGYKLVSEMTGDEFHHFRNWMKSQADTMTARIVEADRVFYSRQAVVA
jgi:hypothetical protein